MDAKNEITPIQNADIMERVLLSGDLSKLSAADRLFYYAKVCESVGLNPLTRPFDYLTLNGKMVLYAKRDATDQLRKVHGVSVTIKARENIEGVYVVTANAKDKTGREDESTGAVTINGVKGDALANALMKAETKAKRRVTLSICGLGMLDETEIETIPLPRINPMGENDTKEPSTLAKLIASNFKAAWDMMSEEQIETTHVTAKQTPDDYQQGWKMLPANVRAGIKDVLDKRGVTHGKSTESRAEQIAREELEKVKNGTPAPAH